MNLLAQLGCRFCHDFKGTKNQLRRHLRRCVKAPAQAEFEQLLQTYTDSRTRFEDRQVLATRLRRMRSRRDRLPPTLVLYRGVSGSSPDRSKGLSWTTSVNTAAWFATQWTDTNMEAWATDPAVYRLAVNRRDVICEVGFANAGDEHEYLVNVTSEPEKLDLKPAQLKKLARI
jgi:hypothetical protein